MLCAVSNINIIYEVERTSEEKGNKGRETKEGKKARNVRFIRFQSRKKTVKDGLIRGN